MALDPNKLTVKAREALQGAQLQARERHHEQVTAEHMLYALLEQDEGLTAALVEMLDVVPEAAMKKVESAMAWLPQVSTMTTKEVGMATDTYRLLDTADRERQKLGDDYMSTEHILLAMAGLPSGIGEVMRGAGITRDGLMRALKSVRGLQLDDEPQPEITEPEQAELVQETAEEVAPSPASEAALSVFEDLMEAKVPEVAPPAPPQSVESEPEPISEPPISEPVATSTPEPAVPIPPPVPVPVPEPVAASAGSSAFSVSSDEVTKLVHMEEVFHGRVVGQDAAAAVVAGAIRRSRAGLSDANRPMGAFIFAGPPGVGKTQLASALAAALFDESVVHFDMSEYAERGSVAQLVGARGSQEAGQLTEGVLRSPASVVLLNDIDKAHPEVSKVVLRIIVDGGITDGHGRAVDFTGTVVVATCGLGDGSDPANTTAILRRHFKPEFLSALDEIVIFRALGEEDLGRIVDIEVASLGDRLSGRGFAIALTASARAYLARAGADPTMGAHALKQLIRREVADPIALSLLQDEFRSGDTIEIGGSATGIRIARQARLNVG